MTELIGMQQIIRKFIRQMRRIYVQQESNYDHVLNDFPVQ